MNQTTAAASNFEGLLRSVDVSASIAAVRDVIRDPTANSSLSLALLAAVVFAVVLLVVFVLMLITPSRKKVVKVRRYSGPRPEGTVAPSAAPAAGTEGAAAGKPPSRLFMALTSSAMIITLVVLAAIGAYVATSTDAYCAKTCHVSSPAAKSGLEIDHTSCASCHGTGGVFGVFANVSDRVRMLWSYGIGRSPKRATVAVDSYSCLRCHRDVESEIVTSQAGVLMSHEEVNEAGQPCSECHAATGHVEDAFTASMATCLPCHDSKTASSECSTCHTSDPGSVSFLAEQKRESLGSGGIVYPAVRASSRDCGGCHDQPKECDWCHGMRMPHTPQYKEGGHAIAAAFERKLVCWTCHDPQFCGASGCHASAFDPETGNTTHGVNWPQEHKAASWDAGCICHTQRSDRTAPICTLCHAPDHSLLPVTQ